MDTNTVHCYNCFKFPSKEVEFFISNCMHIFCDVCKQSCTNPENSKAENCLVCSKPVKFLKLGGGMPEAVKRYFTSSQASIGLIKRKVDRVLTFQKQNRLGWFNYMKKKNENFEKLKGKYIEERNKKEQYKKALQLLQGKLHEKSAELDEFKSMSTISNNTMSPSQAPNPYKTPKKPAVQSRISSSLVPHKPRIEQPPLSSKATKVLFTDPYKTPVMPAKPITGAPNSYVTPKNQTFAQQIPHIDRDKNSLNSNSSSSFIETTSEVTARTGSRMGGKRVH